ncbi:hypothetical protein NA57DRAFT_24134, partial [Rhizodiscina lignyota]
CCCGRADCSFRAHSCEVLQNYEKDARVAAELGQALLVRHEAYVADAEQDRKRMSTTLDSLDTEKRDLEASNTSLVEQNRHFLDQLENLNNALVESETQIKSLTATLHSTQEQLRRVTALVSRTEFLEKQLATLEREQAELQATLATTKEDEKSAVLRSRQAEQAIAGLHDQIERIEQEAREERERHVEVIGRMDRRRAVERELETAAGRLRGAAAAKASSEKNGSNVVSHFVKDILQDNANLQLGIVELRDMLFNSNEEVARLRDQLMLNPPTDATEEGGLSPKLSKEMGLETPQSRELHVHHHFHDLPKGENKPRPQQPMQRKVRRKRHLATSGHFTPPRGSIARPGPQTPSSAATILSQTSVTVPQKSASHRWSVQSNSTAISGASSVPSSPYAHSRGASSVFERIFSDVGHDSSPPTSPDCSDPGSPAFVPLNKLPLRDGPLRSVSDSVAPQLMTYSVDEYMDHMGTEVDADVTDLHLSPGLPSPPEATIPEEGDETDEASTLREAEDEDLYTPSRPMRRVASHESLLSVSGMDIHTLQSRPSQLLIGASARAAPSIALTSSRPVIAATTATAVTGRTSRPGSGRSVTPHSRDLLSNMVGEQRGAAPVDSKPGYVGFLGQRVGGWVKGKWGFMPTPSTAVDTP